MTRPARNLALLLAAMVTPLFTGCDRRESTASAAKLPALPTAPARVTKEAALAAIGTNVILPTLSAFTERCVALEASTIKFRTDPTPESLQQARADWTEAYTAWSAVQWIPTLPYYNLGVYLWPPRPTSIEGALQGSTNYDAAYMNELGAAATGLFALECLLFDQARMVRHKNGQPVPGVPVPSPAWELLTGPNGPRRRAFVQALAELLTRRAREVEEAWKPAGGNAVGKFIAGGQDSLDKLVNRLLENSERTLRESLLQQIGFYDAKTFQPENAQAMSSGSSHRAVLAVIRSVQRHYDGGTGLGLDDYLRTLDPALADTMQAHLEASVKAATAIPMPIEEAVKQARATVEQTIEAGHKLEIALKTDVVSRLGVTLTFISTDGD